MKNYIILIIIASVLFSACNPNKDVYEKLDKVYDVPYSENGLEYTLTENDYASASKVALSVATTNEDSTMAKSIATYNSFNTKFTANDYVPAILTSNFKALKEKSSIVVNYNQYVGEMYGDILSNTLTDADYQEIGGNVATNLCFTSSSELGAVRAYLYRKYPDAVANTYVEVFYRYPDVSSTGARFYNFDGSQWLQVENTTVLVDSDYDAMGSPGGYDNFSEDDKPESYLPQYLATNYPYAQAGDEKLLVCHFYGYLATTYVVACKYDGTDWVINFPGAKMTAQFIHTTTSWLFDPTVRFTMSSADYQLIVDEDPNQNSYGSGGYYYGASSYYSNFDIRLTKRKDKVPDIWTADISDEDGMALIWQYLEEGIVIMLQKKFPEATPDVDGVEVHYFITFDTFDDTYSHTIYTIEYKCTEAGSKPKFELVGEPVVAK